MRRRNWLGVFALLAVVGACNATPDQPQLGRTPQPPTTTAPVTTPSVVSTSTAPPKPAGEQVRLARVIDGDTLELVDGRKVRVLGIDSCEMNTYAGKAAKTEAERLLSGATITLATQPGVTVDRYQRLLRYVQVDDTDFGVEMVKNDHTGVYLGKPNDASPEYLTRLYAEDTRYALNPPAGRNCDDPYPDLGTDSAGVSKGGDYNAPDGALTGGYCRKKWWC